MTTENVLKIKAVVLGHAIGDALGVPVEFCSRAELGENPVTDMRGFGSYPVPAGAWSDDTSMSLAVLDSPAGGKIDWCEIMENFTKWACDGAYTPTGEMFDIGDDTDTTAAVAGALAGALYGYESIPHEWLNTLIKRDYIEKMCEKWQ